MSSQIAGWRGEAGASLLTMLLLLLLLPTPFSVAFSISMGSRVASWVGSAVTSLSLSSSSAKSMRGSFLNLVGGRGACGGSCLPLVWVAGSSVACGGVRAVFMLERKPFVLLASASLVDVLGGPFITTTHSSIGLGSVGAVPY